jgi:hypothetical protein
MSRSWPVLLSLLLASPLAAAEGDALQRTTTDRQIIDLLARVHDQGAALFNQGDIGGCYRMFQGALVTAKLVLPKELQETVDRGLSRAEMQPDPVRRAMALHDLIEEVRKKLHPTAGKGEPLQRPRGVGEGSGLRPMDTVPGVPVPGKGPDTGLPPPGKTTDPKLTEPPPKLNLPPKSPDLNTESSGLPAFTSPEPPKAPAKPPGRINLGDPPPPVLSGLPTSNPKPMKPITDPLKPATDPLKPITDPLKTEPLPVAPRPADPAPPVAPPLDLPTRGDPLDLPVSPPKAPTSPAPPSGPDLNPPPLDLPPPPGLAKPKEKEKTKDPPPLELPAK